MRFFVRLADEQEKWQKLLRMREVSRLLWARVWKEEKKSRIPFVGEENK